jgi:hypothetical protein
MKGFIALLCIVCLGLFGACASQSGGTTTAASPTPSASPKASPTPSVTPSPTPTTTTAPAGKPMILEAEDFTLTGCDIVDDAGASGGKAVLIKYDSSAGTKDLTLDAGNYVVTLYEKAPDDKHDAVYCGVGNAVQRVFPTEWGKWIAAKTFDFTVDKTGPVTFIFTPTWIGQKSGEFGMLIDRFEITKK